MTDTLVAAVFIVVGLFVIIGAPAATIIFGIKLVQGGMALMGKGVGFLTNAARGAGGAYENSRARKMHKEARERSKQKAFLERQRRLMEDPGRRGQWYRRSIRRTLGKGAAGELSESLYKAGKGLESERIQQLDSRLTRGAAIALASGDNFDEKTGIVTDRATGRMTAKLDTEDMAAVRYARATGAMTTTAGAKAVGSKLHALGDMTIDMNQRLIDMGHSAQEKSEINNVLNNAALGSGQLHLGYNALTDDGKILLAGQKTGSKPKTDIREGLAGIISSKGVAALPKEIYSGAAFPQDIVRDVLGNMYYSSQRDSFVRQTLSINEDKKIDGIARALGISRADFDDERKRVSRAYRGG